LSLTFLDHQVISLYLKATLLHMCMCVCVQTLVQQPWMAQCKMTIWN